MKHGLLTAILTTSLLCALLVGCERRAGYTIRNGGNQTLNNVTLRSDSGFAFEHGTLDPGNHSSFSGNMNLRRVNKLTLSWTREDTDPKQQTINVEGQVLQNRRGRMFVISDADTIEETWRHPK